MEKFRNTYWRCYRKVIRTKDFFLYDIKYGVRNLIRWFPIIWKDRNWDHIFIFEMLRKKLYYTEDCIRNGCFIGREREAKRIKTCVLLLDRILKDDYLELTDKGYKHEEYLIKQDVDMLFDIMRKHIRKWWD